MDVTDIINRVKNLKYFDVEIPVPPLFSIAGKVPFTFRIEGDSAVCKVLAEDIVEAERKVLNYFNTQA